MAATDADRAGRDLLCGWLQAAGLSVEIDRIGNIYGIWELAGAEGPPVVMGSHIDTVIDAGIYDGCYGVLSGLAVIEAMQAAGLRPARPLAVAAFTNEEGVRYAPDMMGSLVAAGGLATEAAFATSASTAPPSAPSSRGSAMPARGSRAFSRPTPTWSCMSSRGRCSRPRASRSGRSRTFRAFPGRG